MSNEDRTKVTILYSHKDGRYLERLHVHLAPLSKVVEIWDDTSILPGAVRRQELEKALTQAQVAILLISADFLASRFLVEDELPPLLFSVEENGAVILSVILSSSAFADTELSRFQTVNDPSKPLIGLSRDEKERIWNKVTRIVKNASHPKQQIGCIP
jgi:hypothetical protein